MKALIRFLLFPTAILSVTLAWLWLDLAMGWKGPHWPRLGVALLLAGTALISWCCWLFADRGHGTPHPFAAKTRALVTVGPYAWVRNPMMWAVGCVVVGLALWIGSVGLWLGLIGFILWIRWFVPGWEERDMQKRFGDQYLEYCRRVPRWWPRFPADKS